MTVVGCIVCCDFELSEACADFTDRGGQLILIFGRSILIFVR